MSRTISRKRKLRIDHSNLDKISGLVHQYRGRLLADDSLTDIDVLLLSIYLINQQYGTYVADYTEVKILFCTLGRSEKPNFSVSLSRARKSRLVEKTDDALSLLIKGLKRIRNLLGQFEKSPVHIIKSGQTFSAIKLLEEFLRSEISSKEILLCDPHIDPSTLYPFSILKQKVQIIKILTSNVYEQAKFKSYVKKFAKETAINVEVKIVKVIHDRYLISGRKCWSIGTSIKNLGNKDTIIREISDVVDSLRALFLQRYNDPASTIFI